MNKWTPVPGTPLFVALTPDEQRARRWRIMRVDGRVITRAPTRKAAEVAARTITTWTGVFVTPEQVVHRDIELQRGQRHQTGWCPTHDRGRVVRSRTIPGEVAVLDCGCAFAHHRPEVVR